MRQYDAVEKISMRIIAENLSEAIFLKGSLARKTEDEFSNVDLYVIVKEEKFQLFFTKALSYLESYNTILYHTFVNYLHPEIICIYENGLRVDLYIVKPENLDQTDDIAIIYDPNRLLVSYNKKSLAFTPIEIGNLIDSFCLTSLDFFKAYNRGDYIYCLRLASHLSVDIGTFIRINSDPEYAKMGLKNLINNLDNNYKQKFYEIIKKLKVDSVLESVQLMFVLIDPYIKNLPIAIAENVNFDFFIYTKKLIMSII